MMDINFIRKEGKLETDIKREDIEPFITAWDIFKEPYTSFYLDLKYAVRCFLSKIKQRVSSYYQRNSK